MLDWSDPSTWSAAISMIAMSVSVVFSLAAWAATRRQIRLQQFQMRQDLRNHVRAWADEVVAVLQDGITHCFIYKQNPDGAVMSLHFTTLAGKISELIDRGRWHFENDKENGFGRWKEGAYQGLAPKAISVLKEAHGYFVGAAISPPGNPCRHDHLRENLTARKRTFVSEVQDFVQPSRSINELGGKLA